MYAAHPPGPAQSRSKEVSTSTELLIASPARTVQACREESANRPRPVHNSSLLQFFTSGSGAGNPVGVSAGSRACHRRLRSTYLTDCTVEGEDPVYTVQTAYCYVLYTAHGTWQSMYPGKASFSIGSREATRQWHRTLNASPPTRSRGTLPRSGLDPQPVARRGLSARP
jgi:hypothetical protein